jgi:hypothetical protein
MAPKKQEVAHPRVHTGIPNGPQKQRSCTPEFQMAPKNNGVSRRNSN